MGGDSTGVIITREGLSYNHIKFFISLLIAL